MILRKAHLGVPGYIQEHRAGTAGRGNVESLCHGRGYVLGAAYLVAPLGDRGRKAYHVRLLERIGSQHIVAHLAADNYHGGGIYHCVRNAGHYVGGSRAGGHQHHAGLAAHARISLRGVDGALLVAHQNVPESVLIVVKGVIYGHNLSAGVSPDNLDAYFLEGAHKDVRSLDHFVFFCHNQSSSMRRMPPLSAELTIEAYALRAFETLRSLLTGV